VASDGLRLSTRLRRQLVLVGLVSVAALLLLAVVIEGMLWTRYARSDATRSQPAGRAEPSLAADRAPSPAHPTVQP